MIDNLLHDYANGIAGYTTSDTEAMNLIEGLEEYYETQSVLYASRQRDEHASINVKRTNSRV